MTPLAILEGAREILVSTEHWTQGAYARDEDGKAVTLSHPRAVAFCPEAAVLKAAGVTRIGGSAACKAAAAIFRSVIGGVPIFIWGDNPELTHADVTDALDAAIERAREEELRRG